MRLQKYMAYGQVASRRKSEEIISQNRVKVNGKIINTPGYKVSEDDIVEVDGKIVEIINNYDYFVLNKPVGIVSTADDELNRHNVVDLINTSKRIYPIGRLDMDSEGLIILTNDGDLTEILTHPSYGIDKTYRVKLLGNPSEKELSILRNGIEMDNSITNKAKIRKLKNSNNALIEITINEGKNRQVRRMFEYIGYEVSQLKRISFGEIYLGSLKTGEYRKFTHREYEYINKLKNKYD